MEEVAGLPPLCSGYVNLAGSRAAPLSSSTVGGRRGGHYADLAAEFVALKVDVIVTSGSAAVAVKEATSAIPIVFATANEPIGSGLVASLARPGGNATGMSMQQTDLAGKRLELLREIVPGLGQASESSFSCTIREPCWTGVRFGQRPRCSGSKS